MSYIKKYEYVIAVAREGGISQAADALNIAQPTLSKYLKKLEIELGVELFDRSTIPIKLTAAGKSYVEAGRNIIDMEHQLQKQLQEIKLNKNTVIKIGISPSRSPYLMPSVVEEYRRINPTARIVIKERTTAELNKQLSRGDLDLIISLLDDETKNFEKVELLDEDIILAVPQGMYHGTETASDILLSSTLINVGKGLTLWKTMKEIADKLGNSKPDIECQSIASALALVKRGLGVMLVPSYVSEYGTEEQTNDICFLRLYTDKCSEYKNSYKRKVCLFYRKEQFLTQTEKDFIMCIESKIHKNDKLRV